MTQTSEYFVSVNLIADSKYMDVSCLAISQSTWQTTPCD